MYDKSVKDTGAFDNMLGRYSMSLIGGAIGGGLFYGVEKYKGFNKTRDKDLVDLINDGAGDGLDADLVTLIQASHGGHDTVYQLNNKSGIGMTV